MNMVLLILIALFRWRPPDETRSTVNLSASEPMRPPPRLAGFYLLRDDHETELMESGGLPAERHEVELVIQDRTFCPDGGLAYPDVPSGPGLPSQKVTWPCSVLSLDLDLGLA
jgi:hypothetical protein